MLMTYGGLVRALLGLEWLRVEQGLGFRVYVLGPKLSTLNP